MKIARFLNERPTSRQMGDQLKSSCRLMTECNDLIHAIKYPIRSQNYVFERRLISVEVDSDVTYDEELLHLCLNIFYV